MLQLCYSIGIATSVWNHGTISEIAVWSDRIMMLCGYVIDLHFMSMLPTGEAALVFFTSLMAVIFYFRAKVIERQQSVISSKLHSRKGLEYDRFHKRPDQDLKSSVNHCLAHLSVTVSHIHMLFFLSQQE